MGGMNCGFLRSCLHGSTTGGRTVVGMISRGMLVRVLVARCLMIVCVVVVRCVFMLRLGSVIVVGIVGMPVLRRLVTVMIGIVHTAVSSVFIVRHGARIDLLRVILQKVKTFDVDKQARDRWPYRSA